MNEVDSFTQYVASFVDELVSSGVDKVVISPGSRSTPLAILMAEHPELTCYINIDERSAGFFALGIAKSQKKPVALLCTSGTAAANYYPAIVEAHYARVPLLILTADRPHELRDVGAPQAIDQLHMYGNYPKWFVDLALPEEQPNMLRYARTVAARAVG
jgi:2-succinyl-5-enolpyruvyl-6-hydroxy-3-cyclohexene-1-carboxylate synthase